MVYGAAALAGGQVEVVAGTAALVGGQVEVVAGIAALAGGQVEVVAGTAALAAEWAATAQRVTALTGVALVLAVVGLLTASLVSVPRRQQIRARQLVEW